MASGGCEQALEAGRGLLTFLIDDGTANSRNLQAITTVPLNGGGPAVNTRALMCEDGGGKRRPRTATTGATIGPCTCRWAVGEVLILLHAEEGRCEHRVPSAKCSSEQARFLGKCCHYN